MKILYRIKKLLQSNPRELSMDEYVSSRILTAYGLRKEKQESLITWYNNRKPRPISEPTKTKCTKT